jgi:hypothetical protein
MLQINTLARRVETPRGQRKRPRRIARALGSFEFVDDYVCAGGFGFESHLAAFFADGGGGVDAGDLEFAGFHCAVCFCFFGFEGCFGAGGFFLEAV